MTIYSPSGAVVYEAPITKSAIIRRELMGDYYIELVFDAVDRIDIGRGCYILYNNHRFEIMSNVIPDDTNQGGLRYSLRFEAQQSQMKRCNVFWREGENLEVSFALTSEISTFGQLIIDNVNAFLGGSTFTLGSVPAGAEMKTISFAGDSCWNAVATVAETFGVEWWTEEDGDNVRLCFGKLEVGESVEFKKGDIVSSIPSKKGDDTNYGTRFYVFGSTKNLPEDYGSTVDGGVTNNVVEKRLHLPDGMQYIDAWPNLASEDIVEKTVFFDDVMPTNVETITEVHSGNAEVIPGTSHKVYDVVCANSPFSLDDVIEGETIQANFTSGSLNGQTFDLELTQTNGVFNKTFRIVPKILDRDSLTILPQGEMIPRVGDTFILLNVNLPQGRIDEAEQRLLEVGQEYVKKNSSDTEIYDCPTNAVYCHKNDCNYVLGQRVTLVGEQFGASGRVSRIQGYEKKLYDEYQATYTVGDNSAYSRLASLEKSIQQATYSDRVGLEANIIRSKNDSTIPSDFNVYSALASEEMFLSKRRGGIVKGHTNFEKGISMYGVPFVYDEETKTWVLEGNLVTTRGIAAWGSLSTPVASLFEALPIDGTTIKRDPITKELYVDTTVVGGGGTGGGGVADSVSWSNITGKPDWIGAEKPSYKYSEIGETPDLSIYATRDWVTGKGYITNVVNDNVTINGNRLQPLYIKSQESSTGILFFTKTQSATLMYSGDSNWRVTDNDWGTAYYLLHSGNYSDYALPKDGTAVAASKLATTRSIFGQSFDGSADVTGNIFPINANGCYYNEDGISYHTNKLYQTSILRVTSSYDVAIGGTTASEKLHVYGNILATGTVSGAGGKFTDNVVIAEGKNIMMRSANAQYLSGIGYDTSNNECLVLWAKNSVTRLRWSAGIDLSAGVNTGAMMGITPDFEISKATGAAIGYIAGNTILHSDNYSKYALPLTGGVVNGDVYSKNYRTDGVAYIQRLRIENLNEINGYSAYNGGSATGNAHINYASSGIVTLCNGGGNCAIGGATALDKLHVYGRGRFVMQGKSDQSIIVTEATALTLSTNSAGHTGYNTGIGFNALGDYSNLSYKNHIHAWIGLGGATTTTTSECYPLVFATNPNTLIAGTPVERMRITPDGNVAIGGETASEKLHVYGNILATGGITATNSSDKRLKKNIRKFNASKVLMSLGGVYEYEYIDSEVQKNHIYEGAHYGLIYQHVKDTALDVMCHEREDGMGALNYIHPKFISLIAGATMENISEVEKLKRKIRHLENKVKQLESRA